MEEEEEKGGEVQKLSEHDLLIYNIFLQIDEDLFTAIVIPLNDAGTSSNIKVQTNFKWSVVKLYDHLWLPVWLGVWLCYVMRSSVV